MKDRLFITTIITAVLMVACATGWSQSSYKHLDVGDGKTLVYQVHLPDGFDANKTYPVLIGPGDGVEGAEPGFYWKKDPTSYGWIIVDTPTIWQGNVIKRTQALLDDLEKSFKIEGGRFHLAGWSANSCGMFEIAMALADRFASVTAIPGHPRNANPEKLKMLMNTKVQFIAGSKDSYWLRESRIAHKKLKGFGVDTTLEIVEDGGHVLRRLIGKGFMARLEMLITRSGTN